MEKALPEKRQEGVLHRFFSFISSCMTPLIPTLLGSGTVRVVSTVLEAAGLLSKDSVAFLLLSVIGNSFFYFLPIILAATVAKRIGVDPILAIPIGGILLHPLFIDLVEDGAFDFYPLANAESGYTASILPIFLLIPLMKHIDEIADKLSPSLIKVFFKPFLTVLMASFLLIAFAGPIGSLAGDLLAKGFLLLEERAHPLATFLLSAAMPFITLTGLHYSLLPIASVSFASLGYDPLVSLAMLTTAFSLGGASLAAAIACPTRKERQISLAASLSAILAGVTEPSLFGVTLRYRHPLLSVSIASGLAGLLAGARGTVVYRSGTPPSIFTLVQMISEDAPHNVSSGLLVLTVAFTLSFFISLIVYRMPQPQSISKGATMKETNQLLENPTGEAIPPLTEKTLVLTSPLSGVRIPLHEVKDETFAEGYLGRGCAVIPSDGHVYAPVNGKIVSLFDTRHAVTILSEDGAEILIHVGRDTVTLGGRYFKAYRQNGDDVKTGDLLLSFDLDALEKEGFDLTTPIVVTNDSLYKEIEPFDNEEVTAGDPLLRITDDGKKTE